MRGYAESNPDVVVREKVRIDKALVAPSGTPEFLNEYEQKWGDNKKELLKQGIESGKYPNAEVVDQRLTNKKKLLNRRRASDTRMDR